MAELRELEHEVQLRRQDRRRRRLSRSILSRELVQKIGRMIAAGSDKKTVAEAVGVSRKTFWAWMTQGRREHDEGQHTLHAYLAEVVTQADARRRMKMETSTYGHALEDGRLGLQMLGKMDRETWGDHEAPRTVNINIGITPDMRLLAERLTSDELFTLCGLLEKAFGSGGAGDVEGNAGSSEPDGLHAVDVPGVSRQLAPSTDS